MENAKAFMVATLLWFDLLACTSCGTSPKISSYELWLDHSGIEIGPLMGCYNWTMKAIGDIGTLSARVASGGTEVPAEALDVKKRLEAGLSQLDSAREVRVLDSNSWRGRPLLTAESQLATNTQSPCCVACLCDSCACGALYYIPRSLYAGFRCGRGCGKGHGFHSRSSREGISSRFNMAHLHRRLHGKPRPATIFRDDDVKDSEPVRTGLQQLRHGFPHHEAMLELPKKPSGLAVELARRHEGHGYLRSSGLAGARPLVYVVFRLFEISSRVFSRFPRPSIPPGFCSILVSCKEARNVCGCDTRSVEIITFVAVDARMKTPRGGTTAAGRGVGRKLFHFGSVLGRKVEALHRAELVNQCENRLGPAEEHGWGSGHGRPYHGKRESSGQLQYRRYA